LVYFGKASTDPLGQAALSLWLKQRDELLAVRKPRPKSDGLTLIELCNKFIHAKQQQAERGELAGVTLRDYKIQCQRLLDSIGKTHLVSDLRIDDFDKLRQSLRVKW
jgi:hypothetical protein